MENIKNFILEEYQKNLELKRIEESVYLKKLIESLNEDQKSSLPIGDLNLNSVLDSLDPFTEELKENTFYNYLIEAEDSKKSALDNKKSKMIAKYQSQLEQVKSKIKSIKEKMDSSTDEVEKLELEARIKKGSSAKAKIQSIIKKLEGDEKAKEYAKLAELISAEAEAQAKYAKLKTQEIESSKNESVKSFTVEDEDFNDIDNLFNEYFEIVEADKPKLVVPDKAEKKNDSDLKQKVKDAEIELIKSEI